eukprot:750073-Amphidinium_carterae.2
MRWWGKWTKAGIANIKKVLQWFGARSFSSRFFGALMDTQFPETSNQDKQPTSCAIKVANMQPAVSQRSARHRTRQMQPIST